MRYVVLLCFLLCSGCASYHTSAIVPHLAVTGTGTLVVLTHDQRSYIVSGGTEPTFVGLLRSPVGIPWPMKTQSGRPFADDMTHMVCQALTRQGFHCVPLSVAARARPAELPQTLQAHAGTPALVLTLHEWKSDTHTDTAVAYDVTMRLLDPQGIARTTARIQGRDVLGGTFWNSSSFAATAVPQAVQKHLEALLNDPAMLAALQTVHRPALVVQPVPQPAATPSALPTTRGVVRLQAQYDAFRLFLHPQTSAERLSPVPAGVPLAVLEDRGAWVYVVVTSFLWH